jgi:hypothetical protein
MVVVNRMMGWTNNPPSQPVMGKSNWELLQAQVINHSPNCHRCQHGQNGAEMQRDKPHNTNKKHGMGQRFHGLKSE